MDLDDAIRSTTADPLGEILAAAAGLVPPSDRPSILCERLVEYAGWGRLYCTDVQYLAEGALLDGLKHPEVNDLFKLGTSGEHIGNCRRDLFGKYKNYKDLPKPTRVKNVPYIETKDGVDVLKYTEYPIIFPHQTMDCLHDNFKEIFDNMMGMGPEQFWAEVT
jgi:hypothetical protein